MSQQIALWFCISQFIEVLDQEKGDPDSRPVEMLLKPYNVAAKLFHSSWITAYLHFSHSFQHG